MKTNNNFLLLVGCGLILIGFFKIDIGGVVNLPLFNNDTVVSTNVEKPKNDKLLQLSEKIVTILKAGGSSRRTDGLKLSALYTDLATLISLDDTDTVIKNTEEIREANRISGLMSKLNIKNKYKNLADACNAVMIEAIGDDNVVLNDELRDKAVEAFHALAWACNQGAK